jgi:hypothetical protein
MSRTGHLQCFALVRRNQQSFLEEQFRMQQNIAMESSKSVLFALVVLHRSRSPWPCSEGFATVHRGRTPQDSAVDAKTDDGKRRQWAPEAMQEALAIYDDPLNAQSLYAIAKEKKVPDRTFRDYVSLGRTTIPPMGRSPVLSPFAKTGFVDWLGDRCMAAAPVPRPLANEKLKGIVNDLRKERGDKQREFGTLTGEPGKNWWAELRRQYVEVRLRVPSRHSAATLRATLNPATYTKFFGGVRGPLSGIRKPRRFTADEFALSANKNKGKVLYIEGSGRCEAMEADGYSAHVSLMNLVAGDGEVLETALIYGQRNEALKVERLTDKVITLGYTSEFRSESASHDVLVWCTETGWQNERSFLTWLQWFRDRVKPTLDDPVALIVDQHSTRFSLRVREFCRANHIMLVLLPPNMTSKLAVIHDCVPALFIVQHV